MAKPKRKLLRPHSEVVAHLLSVILLWTREELAKKVDVDPRTIDSVLGGSSKYNMSVLLYDSLCREINKRLVICQRPQIKGEELLRDYQGAYTPGLGLERFFSSVIPTANQARAFPLTGRGTAQELRALDHKDKFHLIKDDPVYYGPIPQITLTIEGRDAILSAEEITMYKDVACSEMMAKGHLTANGLYSAGCAYLVYSFQDVERNLAWDGVLVLTIPATGNLCGYWLTEGHNEHGRVVIGSLRIERS